MIRPIDIRLNAAHPELPLVEAFTFTGSPSTVLIRNVPPNCGRWAITAVNVAATFPDNSTTTRAAVQSANGVWVATLPATATSGRTASGLRIMADGIDENGEIVTGYILGVADFAVASLGVTPAPEPGATSYPMLYFDTAPSVLRKGDVTKIDGVLKFYDGTAWLPFAEIDPSGYVPTSRTINGEPLTDNVSLSGSDIPTTAAPDSPTLANSIQTLTNTTQTLSDSISTLNNTKANKSDATLTPIYSDTPTFSEWTFSDVSDGITDIQQPVLRLHSGGESSWQVSFGYEGQTLTAAIFSDNENVTNLAFEYSDEGLNLHLTATRTHTDVIGYRLGPDADTNPNRDKPLASEAEAEALRQGKQDALTTTQLANIEAVPGKLDKSGGTVTGELRVSSNSANLYVNGDSISFGPFFTIKSGEFHIGRDGVILVPATSGTLALTAGTGHNGNLAALDANGNPTDSLIPAANVAVKSNIPYDLVTKTISNNAVTLDDRAANAVTINSTLSPNTLTVNFPTATTGKVRDFALRLNIAAGVTAPEITWPQGVTLENDGGEVPEIADGGTGGSSTILYFSETATNKFLVKGETLTAIAQA